MSSVNKVKVDIKGWDKMVKRVISLGQYRAHVGVLASKGGQSTHGDSRITLLELAAIHEFGSPAAGIPERSFIRSAFNDPEAKAEFTYVTSQLARKVLLGQMSAKKATSIAGILMVSIIKRRIMSGPGIPPPNAPSTIARKKSSRTLVDTGQLVGAITHEVRVSGKSRGGDFSASIKTAAKGRR